MTLRLISDNGTPVSRRRRRPVPRKWAALIRNMEDLEPTKPDAVELIEGAGGGHSGGASRSAE